MPPEREPERGGTSDHQHADEAVRRDDAFTAAGSRKSLAEADQGDERDHGCVYDELLKMLAVVAPSRVDRDRSSVRFDRDCVHVDLVHADRRDWTVSAMVDDRDGIVSSAYAHEHFGAWLTAERAWTTQTVDFMAELLRGEIEIETTFRGDIAVMVEHFNAGDAGERVPLGHTGFLVPGRICLWRPRRTETERISFG